MALPLGEHRDEHIGAGDLLAARALDMDHRALNRPLEPGGRRGLDGVIDLQIVELLVDIFLDRIVELFEIDAASAHHCGGILVVDQDKEEVFERGVFVMSFVSRGQRSVKGPFEIG